MLSGSSGSMYKVPGLSEVPGILLAGVNIADKEDAALQKTLKGEKVLYSFGSDYGSVTISGELLFGGAKSDNTKSNSTVKGLELYKTLTAWYQENKVSAKKAAIPISIAGDQAFQCFILSLTIGTPNAELQTLPFTITGVKV